MNMSDFIEIFYEEKPKLSTGRPVLTEVSSRPLVLLERFLNRGSRKNQDTPTSGLILRLLPVSLRVPLFLQFVSQVYKPTIEPSMSVFYSLMFYTRDTHNVVGGDMSLRLLSRHRRNVSVHRLSGPMVRDV